MTSTDLPLDLRSAVRLRQFDGPTEQPLTESQLFAAYGVDVETVGEEVSDASM